MHKATKGFTLIELAIVIAIIGILAMAAVMNFNNNIRAAELGKLRAILNTLNSGSAMSTAINLTTPNTFGAFVGTTTAHTVRIDDVRCSGTTATFICNFDRIRGTYTLDPVTGQVTMATTDL